MKKAIKLTLKTILAIVGLLLILAVGLILFLTFTEYSPQPIQAPEKLTLAESATPAEQSLTIYSWNIGYAGLGKASDFFMDGGEMVNPPSQQAVETNMAAIESYVRQTPADIWLIQEADLDCSRTDSMNQYQRLQDALQGSSAFACNYKCAFVPYPIPPMGSLESGIATYTDLAMYEDAQRISLPCPFSWPGRVANMKRCLLVTRIDVADTDRDLVVINLHLEAFESGEGRIAQTNQLLQLMQEEYEKGNYVIAGGDFNQTFPNMYDIYPITSQEVWVPGALEADGLPEGWQYAYDTTTASCRSMDKPYDGTNQLYAIDGFILSPNVRLEEVAVQPLGFENADHDPVRLEVTLLP